MGAAVSYEPGTPVGGAAIDSADARVHFVALLLAERACVGSQMGPSAIPRLVLEFVATRRPVVHINGGLKHDLRVGWAACNPAADARAHFVALPEELLPRGRARSPGRATSLTRSRSV